MVISFIRGYYTVIVEGLGTESFLNYLIRNKIYVYNVNRIEKTKIQFDIDRNNFKKLKKIYRNNKFDIKIKKQTGIPFIARRIYTYRGMVICKAHSVHVFEDARTMPRDEDHMEVILHEDVHSKEEVMALGIDHGDVISVDPHFEYTPSGYVVSRYIDDKAAVAALIEMMAYFKRNNLKPKYRTLLAFPIYEEIGHGGAYVPEEVEEYVALDIGLIGPDYHADEKTVSICAKDNYSPYDRELTTRIINQAKKTNLNYCVDVFFHYGTDANAAIRAGNNVYAAAFGMAVINSHGKERCHIDSIVDTTKLAIAYALDL